MLLAVLGAALITFPHQTETQHGGILGQSGRESKGADPDSGRILDIAMFAIRRNQQWKTIILTSKDSIAAGVAGPPAVRDLKPLA